MTDEYKCCEDWEDAQKPGTDHEGYGCLLLRYLGDWVMGAAMEPIQFCPWCGEKKSPSRDPLPVKVGGLVRVTAGLLLWLEAEGEEAE